MFSVYVKLLRPHHWLKNLFVFAAPFFTGAWLDLTADMHLALVFAAFCAAASCVYVFNDIVDAPADRLHPTKKRRPIARGKISPLEASVLAVALGVLALLAGYFVSTSAVILIGLYLALNVVYTFGGKKVPIADVFFIATGFALRMLAGGPALGIGLSPLLLAAGFFFTVMLGFGKRRVELALLGARAPAARPSLADCTLPLLDTLCAMFAGLSLASYTLWTVGAPNFLVVFSLLPASFGFARHFFMMHSKGHGEDLAREVFVDIPLLSAAAIFALMVGGIGLLDHISSLSALLESITGAV
jgi:4-hydroxybenzoate polyprenyltransferase